MFPQFLCLLQGACAALQLGQLGYAQAAEDQHPEIFRNAIDAWVTAYRYKGRSADSIQRAVYSTLGLFNQCQARRAPAVAGAGTRADRRFPMASKQVLAAFVGTRPRGNSTGNFVTSKNSPN